MEDDRFKDIYNAPLFQKMARMTSNAKLGDEDSRFSALKSDKFDFVPGKVDKYGRRNQKGKEDKTKKSQFFDKNQNKSNKSTGAEKRLDYLTRLSRGEISGDSSSSSEDDDSDEDDIANKSNKKALVDSVDGRVEEEDDISEEEVEHIEDATTRLAIQNCDWMHIKAEDLFVVLQSFCPSGQVVKSVQIYPSNFGLERMALEEKYGPAVVWKEADEVEDNDSESENDDSRVQKKHTLQSINSDDDDEKEEEEDNDDDDDDDDENDFGQREEDETRVKNKKKEKGDFFRRSGSIGIVLQSSENNDHDDDDEDGNKKGTTLDEFKLREYELAKMKYYFAVAEFDSPQTAETVYAELDGLEFASSSMLLDLRFIPDEVSFKDRIQKDYADTIPADYVPSDFIVQVLQQTKVECTWDAGDPDREARLNNTSRWRDLAESDFQQYIASSQSESGSEESGEENSESESEVAVIKNKSKSKATKEKKGRKSSYRKLLLGGHDSASDSDECDEEGNDKDLEKDSFFDFEGDEDDSSDEESSNNVVNQDEDDDRDQDHEDGEDIFGISKSNKKRKNEDGIGYGDKEGEMTMTFIPKTSVQETVNDTSEENKRRKKNKKNTKTKSREEKDDDENENAPELKDQLALMFAGEDNSAEDVAGDLRGYEKRRTKKAERKAKMKEKIAEKNGTFTSGKTKSKSGNVSNHVKESFQVNYEDSRFKALFDGQAKFGIDTTASEYRETDTMKNIMKEQRKRREKGDKIISGKTNRNSNDESHGGSNGAMELAQKLKNRMSSSLSKSHEEKKKRI